jgi:hypothetical protein
MEAFLAGAIQKLHDDLTDNNIIHSDIAEKALFALHCFLFGSLFSNDFNFVFITYLTTCLNNYIVNPKPANNTEKGMMISGLIFFFTTYSSATWFSYMDLVYLVYINLASGIEPLFIHEEHSLRKLVIRAVGAIFVLFLTYVGVVYNLIGHSMHKYFIHITGYLIASVCFQLYKFFSTSQESNLDNNDSNNNAG